MYAFNGYDISLTRGDTLTFALVMEGRTIPANARALFTVKARPRDERAAIEKNVPIVNNTAVIELLPEDTRDMRARVYCWDARVLYANGEVRTPMEYAAFEVTEVIGDG